MYIKSLVESFPVIGSVIGSGVRYCIKRKWGKLRVF